MGKKDPWTTFDLKFNDIWKIGESVSPETRYPKSQLQSWGVWMQKGPSGPSIVIKTMEVFEIMRYVSEHGDLPLGNKMFR